MDAGLIEKRSTKWKWLIAAALIMFAGCGDDFSASNNFASEVGAEGIGATTGGAQDIAYARSMIESGQIPYADSITVEGLLAEHDLPTVGEPCEDLLCIRPAVGVAPSLETGELETWLHLGMSSGLDADFRHPPMDAIVVIDKSAAMSIDMAETNDAVTDIIDGLDRSDRLAIVTFDDSAHTFLELTPVAELDREDLKRRVRNIPADGEANLEAGLTRGFNIARAGRTDDTRLSRVLTLSCGYPDTGRTDHGSFRQMVESAADDGIGVSFFGVLLGYDHRLAEVLGNERGGNYFYLNDLERVEQILDEEFEYIVTPLAYDLRMKLGIDTQRFEIAEVYGLPGEPGAAESAFEVKTVFPSNRKGAMVVRLKQKGAASEAAGDVATLGFSYSPEPALGWDEDVEMSLDVTQSSVEGSQFDSIGVRKSVALVNMAQRMKDAIETKDVTILQELRTYLEAEATALGDADLHAEVDLIDKLIALF